MRVVMVAAVSLDGFIADSEGRVTSWTSKEDQEFFATIKKRYRLFVMGSGTFDTSPKYSEQGTLRIVLTRSPEKYRRLYIDGQLEFHDLTPQEFVDTYSDQHKTCLLLGGGHIYEAFLQADLVDEIYLTTEPVKLDRGTPLLPAKELNLDEWQLQTKNVLNQNGTVLEHYIFQK